MRRFNFTRFVSVLIINVFFLLTACTPKATISYAVPEPYHPSKQEPLSVFVEEQPKKEILEAINKPESSYSGTIWERLFDLYALPEVYNARVKHELKRYLKTPDYLITIQTRAAPYLYSIIEEIEARNLPGELALLPVVESAFKPQAYSRSKAAGLWQFIPSTGRYFGLQQNWWYDGRRDVHASTVVAVNYLKELNETFDGDWMLALASYNAGKGTVSKAIRKNKRLNKPTDYWSLNLSKEAEQYVPRLLAVAHIFANADKYNIELLPIPNEPAFEIVDVESQLDLTVAAKLAETPMKEFMHLNPGFKRWCTAPNGPHELLIPVDKAETFKQKLSRLSDHERMIFNYSEPTSKHRIQPGENLGSIARKYGCTIQDLRQFNQLKSNRIIAGRYLFIPASDQEINDYLRGKTFNKNKREFVYIVKKGDSMWEISRRFSVTVKNLLSWNRLKANSPLYPGQKLLIKNSKAQITTENTSHLNPFHTVKYTVKKGDSLSNISRKFNVPMKDLQKWNSLDPTLHIYPGQELKVLVNQLPTT